MEYSNQCRYTKEHEWIKIEGETGSIGITDFAQHYLGDILSVELPESGAEVLAGQPFGSVESAKSVSEVCAPMSGTVIGSNDELKKEPGKINQDANQAWMIKVRLTNPGEVSGLLSLGEYEEFMKQEEEGH
ncbi:MAG: glycine cleavage system protein GcvH [Candidatus Korobacteraceae bacterium]|jgi:glycine cleavage system H protein